MSDNPNAIQHGGDHYRKAGDNQHWDMLPALGFGWEYYIGAATKYLTRVKEGIDVAKAGHFIDKLVWLIEQGKVPTDFQTTSGMRLNSDTGRRSITDVNTYLETYFTANSVPTERRAAISKLMQARTVEDLRAARDAINQLGAEATPAYVNQDGPKPGTPAPPPPPNPGPKPGDAVPRPANSDKVMTTANTEGISGR